MYKKGIVIHWKDADEFIEFDFNNLKKLTFIDSTKEWWHRHKSIHQYNTSSKIINNNDGSITIKITYRHEENTHLDKDDVSWGVSTFTLKEDSFSGYADWDDFDDQKNKGPCPWEIIDRPLIQEKEKISYSKKKRNQEKFKNLLLALDQECIISGESSTCVLEAAHIIPSSKGGIEWPTNGFILRSDIHKLYDANIFEISSQGKIVKIKKDDISDYYLELLKNRTLPSETFDRVKDALKIRAKLA